MSDEVYGAILAEYEALQRLDAEREEQSRQAYRSRRRWSVTRLTSRKDEQ